LTDHELSPNLTEGNETPFSIYILQFAFCILHFAFLPLPGDNPAMNLDIQDIWIAIAIGAGILLAVAIVLTIVVSWLHRHKPRAFDNRADLSVDVSALADRGPAPGGPQLTFYGTPVRLAVLVLAPVGREGELPPADELPRVLEELLPNLNAVLARDAPIFRRWPAQLSSQGFLHSFFHHLALPGHRGKNTPWCSVAGKFTAAGTQYLVGMVCCSEKPNGFSQVVVDHEGRWLDVVRVRTDDPRS
jgi:hypothetical protein